MISIQNLSFDYANFLALQDISVDIPNGSITALVGPNGAGKTTLMRCLTALTLPTSGKILMDEIDIAVEPHACHRITGFLADNFGLYEQLTIEQSIGYFAAAHGLKNEERIEQVIAQVHLTNKTHELIKNLSRGMRQRVGIAQAIIHQPKYLILDEPASGLDPEARIELAGLFFNLNQVGITLIVSSHILAELDQYANNLLILKNGKIVESGFDMNVENKKSVNHFVIHAANISLLYSFPTNEMYEVMNTENDKATIAISEKFTLQDCMQYFMSNGLQVSEFYKETGNIQDAYLKTIKNA